MFFGLELREGAYILWTGITRRNIYSLSWNFKKEHFFSGLEFQEGTYILRAGFSRRKILSGILRRYLFPCAGFSKMVIFFFGGGVGISRRRIIFFSLFNIGSFNLSDLDIFIGFYSIHYQAINISLLFH